VALFFHAGTVLLLFSDSLRVLFGDSLRSDTYGGDALGSCVFVYICVCTDYHEFNSLAMCDS